MINMTDTTETYGQDKAELIDVEGILCTEDGTALGPTDLAVWSAYGDNPQAVDGYRLCGFKEQPTLDLAEVETILRRMSRVDSLILGTEARIDAEIAAVTARLQPDINKAQRTREWLEKTYTPLLRDFAMQQLSTMNGTTDPSLWKKGKTWKCAAGSLSFKNYDGKLAPKKGKAAEFLAWVKDRWPSAVKSVTPEPHDEIDWAEESFCTAVAAYLSPPKDDGAVTTHAATGTDLPDFVECEPAGMRFYTSTGIKGAK